MILVIGKLNKLWYIYIKIFNKKDNKNSKKGKFDIDIMKELTDEEKEKLKKNLTDESCKYMKIDKNLNIDMTEDLMEQSSTMGK